MACGYISPMLRLFTQRKPVLRSFHFSSTNRMPMVNVATNIVDSKIPRTFENQLTDILADSMGKPKSRISVNVQAGSRLIHGGSNHPVIVISIRSIGAVGPEENIRHTSRITELCAKELNIPKEKVVIEFFNLTPDTVGLNGTTVAAANA